MVEFEVKDKMAFSDSYEFDSIINDITNHPKFSLLKEELHHGISRYEHSLRVAHMTYRLSYKFHLDYERATRAALLHDFYLNSETEQYSSSKTLVQHPLIALKNAKEHFDLDMKQENMIESHMFPLSKKVPKHIESWVISFADKFVAVHEMARYKASLMMGIYIIFLFNMITIQK